MVSGWTLIIIGMLIAFASMLFALANFLLGTKSNFDNFDGIFRKHLGAMAGMVIGGAVMPLELL